MKKLLSIGIAISLLGLVLEAILYGLSFNLITFIALILLLGFSLLKFSKREALLQKSIKISNLYSKGKFEARILQIQEMKIYALLQIISTILLIILKLLCVKFQLRFVAHKKANTTA